ncbi:MAG: hypothetical protein ACD_60C00071G0003 [uncultured bacterium]|nr:MAG: hypothetical protein ACD_60C00071G0003 [uncultured bacterium]
MVLCPVILAAGLGKRMHSQSPKVLHCIGGKPLLEHIVLTASQLGSPHQPIVIYGHQGAALRRHLAHLSVTWVEQREQLGTGHALLHALPHLPDNSHVLVLYGDVPLITARTLQHLIQQTKENALGIITARLRDPAGLGRIVRDDKNKIISIIEEKDLLQTQKTMNEINSGIYLIPEKYLREWLPKLHNDNAQHEFYLTDLISIAVQNNISIHSIEPFDEEEILGVNNRQQLSTLERFYQKQGAEKLMLQGTTLLDPERFDLRGEAHIGQDVVIDINVILEGNVTIGHGCVIGPHTVLRNAVIGDHVEIKAYSIIDGAEIANHCVIGPFARLRPGTVLSENAHVGNFVEVKNSMIGTATKINHLSYIGDSEIGKQVNIGAGTITCNYDGVNKHKTVIADHAFIGSNTALVAPVTIGEAATIGAGSTITNDAPAKQLTLGRAKQLTILHWQRPEKKELSEKIEKE